MRRPHPITLALACVFLAACCSPATPAPQASAQPAPAAAASAQPIATVSPSPMGTWDTLLSGTVTGGSTEPAQPLAGAVVTYKVHSYFPELQAGKANQTTTDAAGRFELPVTVHDTDSIWVVIEATGYISHEERLVGIDLQVGRVFEVRLTPE